MEHKFLIWHCTMNGLDFKDFNCFIFKIILWKLLYKTFAVDAPLYTKNGVRWCSRDVQWELSSLFEGALPRIYGTSTPIIFMLSLVQVSYCLASSTVSDHLSQNGSLVESVRTQGNLTQIIEDEKFQLCASFSDMEIPTRSTLELCGRNTFPSLVIM